MEAKWLVNLDVPAAPVKHLQFVLRCRFGVQEGGDHDLPPGLELPYLQRCRGLLVLLRRHPIWSFLRLLQYHQVIACTEFLAGCEVGAAFACTVLLEHAVNAPLHQFAEEKVRRIEGVAKQDIARIEGIEHAAQ